MTARQTRQVISPLLPIWGDAERTYQVRELLFGEQFKVHDSETGTVLGEAVKDGYRGYVDLAGLGTPDVASHFVSSRASHIYPAPDIKSPPLLGLTFGSLLTIKRAVGAYLETGDGSFVPAVHVRARDQDMDDPASVAEIFLGTPYLWGGNSCWGVDCSGLVQAALLACGVTCPPDSGQQQGTVGEAIGDDVAVARGDLIFWKGHVAMALDDRRLIHATAFHMAVVVENIKEVIARIADQGHGPVLARRRP